MNFRKILFFVLCMGLFSQAEAQQWTEMMEDPAVNFYDVQQAFNQAWGNQPYTRGKGWKQYKRWEYFMEERTFPHGKRPRPGQAWEEHNRFQAQYRSNQSFGARAANWTPLGPASWTNSTGWNPGNGRINCVAQHPTNSAIVYAGAPAGGLWKTTNSGASWVCLTDDQPVLGVSAILIHPGNADTLYIGTGDGDGSDTYSIGVLKSTDAGATWQTTGLNWSTGNTRLIRRMIMHPTNYNIILAATNNGIYRTTDGGATWTQTLTGSMRDVEYKSGDPMTVYACTDELYKSTDGGQNWLQITTGLPAAADVNRASIAVTPANPNYVYVLFGGTDSGFFGLYRSTNSGTSFTLRSNTPNIFTYDQTGSGTGGQSWYDMALAVSTTNAEEVYSGGINVWKSTNGGTSWNILTHWVHPATLGYVHADIHTLDFFGSNLYCGSDGGLFKSTNAGVDWTNYSTGMEIMQFYGFGASAQNAYQIIGGAQDNGTNYLNNNTWTHVLGAEGMEAAIDPTNSLIMYGETQSGGLNRTMDGGANWTDIVPAGAGGAAWVMPYVIDPNNAAILYAGFEEVWKTTNRGNTWTQISSFGTGATLRYIAVAPSNSDYIYAGTAGTLRKTINGGTSWTTITPNLPGGSAVKYIAIDPINEQRLWISLSGFNSGEKVFYSGDAGLTWTNVSGNLPNLPINCITYQAGSADGLYVGTDVGVYYKDNNLSTWQPYMTNLPNVMVYELEIHYGVNKLRAATYGRGIWESDLYTPSPFPPNADFSYTEESLCAGDSIKFTDQSLNAAPGWTWYFPGGSPASSTLQNPMVAYPTSGTYTAKLVVNNANGVDSITQTVQVNYAPNRVTVEILLDNYPGETTWDITDATGNVLVSGGPYSAAATTVTEQVCIIDGCFTFTIYDSYGDGICCGFGNGNYQVLDSANNVLASGGQFLEQDATTICFNQLPPVSIDAVNTTVSTCGGSTGTITITGSGGTPPYLYSLNGSSYQGGNVFSLLSAGSYTVYIQDAAGQTSTAAAVITQNNGPTAVALSNATTVYLDQGASVNFNSILSTNATSFSWNFGDGGTSSSAATSHAYTAVGTYMVILTAFKESCTHTDTLYITVDLNNAIAISPNAEIQLNLMPNPVQGEFDIQIDLPELEENVEIHIHNALGQQVYWEKLVGSAKQINRHLNFGNEPAGMYILTVYSPMYKTFKSFVKVK